MIIRRMKERSRNREQEHEPDGLNDKGAGVRWGGQAEWIAKREEQADQKRQQKGQR